MGKMTNQIGGYISYKGFEEGKERDLGMCFLCFGCLKKKIVQIRLSCAGPYIGVQWCAKALTAEDLTEGSLTLIIKFNFNLAQIFQLFVYLFTFNIFKAKMSCLKQLLASCPK